MNKKTLTASALAVLLTGSGCAGVDDFDGFVPLGARIARGTADAVSEPTATGRAITPNIGRPTKGIFDSMHDAWECLTGPLAAMAGLVERTPVTEGTSCNPLARSRPSRTQEMFQNVPSLAPPPAAVPTPPRDPAAPATPGGPRRILSL